MKLLIMYSSPFPCQLSRLHRNTCSADHAAPHCVVFPTPLLFPSVTPQYLQCSSCSTSVCSFPYSPVISLPNTTITVVQFMQHLTMQFSPLPSLLPLLNHNTWCAYHAAAHYAFFATPLLAPSLTPQYLSPHSIFESSKLTFLSNVKLSFR